jgi:MFS transporter, DHA2 family, metal-tetracycline-proton antiporter
MVLAAVVFIAVTTGTMINVALPFIGRHFRASEASYSWIVTGYTLTFGIFSAIHGRLADVYGARRLYVLGLYLFGGTAIAVAFSPTLGVAVSLRIFQGAGAAALPSLGSAIISRLFPPHQRGAAMGVILGTVGLAASLGPFLGGLLLELFNWRAVFLFTAVVLLAVPFALKLLPLSLDQTSEQRFDVIGATLLGLGAAGLMYSLNLLESHGVGLLSATLGAASFAVLGLFVLWIRRRPQPFVQPALFADRRFVAGLVVASAANATRFGTIVLVPILLVEVSQISPLQIGAVLFPGALAIAALSHRSGRWADRVGCRPPVLLGLVAISLGILVTALMSGVSVVGVAAGMTLYGIGFAYIQSPLMGATSQLLPSAQTGVGLGMFLMIFFLGGAFGVAFTVTVVAVQGRGAESWLGLGLGGGAPFSNAILLLLAFSLLGLAFLRRLPGPHPEPLGTEPAAKPATTPEVFNPRVSSDF